jgi:hypothetical protein
MVIGNSRVATFTKETRVLLNTELIKSSFPYEKVLGLLCGERDQGLPSYQRGQGP